MDEKQVRICIVLVNYNGHKDTIECLESLFGLSDDNFTVIVVDNSENKGSLDHIKSWADGKDIFASDSNCPVAINVIDKPIKYQLLYEDQLSTFIPEKVTIIKANNNRGFAAANNLAVKYLDGNYDWLWFLNNDTVVDKYCLANFNKYIKGNFDSSEGIIGTNLYYYNKPTQLQGIGGLYNKWFAVSKNLSDVGNECTERMQRFYKNVDYVIGASMFVSKNFIDVVGMMDERYFLFFEEIDWSTRGQRSGFKIGYVCDCDVYHKEGVSIGSANGAEKSQLSDYYSLKNRLTFTRKFYPVLLPLTYLSLLLSAILRLYRRQFKRVFMVMKIILSGF